MVKWNKTSCSVIQTLLSKSSKRCYLLQLRKSIHQWILFLIYSLVGKHTAFCFRDFVNQSRLRIIIKKMPNLNHQNVLCYLHILLSCVGWGAWRMRGFTPSRNRFFSSSGPGIRLGVLYWCCASGQSWGKKNRSIAPMLLWAQPEEDQCVSASLKLLWPL